MMKIIKGVIFGAFICDSAIQCIKIISQIISTCPC